jgi:hypothetical protein
LFSEPPIVTVKSGVISASRFSSAPLPVAFSALSRRGALTLPPTADQLQVLDVVAEHVEARQAQRALEQFALEADLRSC